MIHGKQGIIFTTEKVLSYQEFLNYHYTVTGSEYILTYASDFFVAKTKANFRAQKRKEIEDYKNSTKITNTKHEITSEVD